jgi:hypothetical protein
MVANDIGAALETMLQAFKIEFDVPSDGVTRWQIFGFYLRTTAGTIEFHDAYPKGIRREIELAGDQRRMNFPRIAVVEETSFFVILSCRTEIMPAPLADPTLPCHVQEQILRDANVVICFRCHCSILQTPSSEPRDQDSRVALAFPNWSISRVHPSGTK